MLTVYARVMLIIAAALPLGGCNSFMGIHMFGKATQRPSTEAKLTEAKLAAQKPAAAPLTETGRRELDAGRTGTAIEQFQKALGNGEPIGPAVNGMGVAYARLGRFDLAKRFMEEAMAADPLNESYQKNLALLMRSPVFAMRHDGDVTARLVKEAAAPTPAAAQIRAEAAPQRIGSLQRVSRSEVHIATGALYSAPIAGQRSAGTRSPQPDRRLTTGDPLLKGFKPIVRIPLSNGQPARSEPASPAANAGFRPLVRLVLPAARPLDRTEGKSAKVVVVTASD